MTPAEVYSAVEGAKVIAIVRGVPADAALPLADALFAGGIRLMEVTCNTPGAAGMVKELARERGDRMLIGAGTVVTHKLAEEMLEAGASYVIAPDVNPEVIGCCLERGVAVIPGASTPTEILTAWRLGASMVKLFPAGAFGCDYIKQIRGPIDSVKLVAVGGVSESNMTDYLKAGCVAVGLGASLIDPKLVVRGAWDELTALAAKITARIEEFTA